MKSSQNLESVVREFNLPVTTRALDRQLRVTRPHNAEAVSLTLEWPDPNVGSAVVNRLMEMQCRQVAELRKAKVGEAIAHVRAERERCVRDLEAARTARAALPADATPPLLLAERELLGKEISALDSDLKAASLQLRQCEEKLKRCEAQLSAAREGDPGAAAEFAVADADQPYRKRKEQLIDALQAEEHKAREVQAQLPSKESDLESLRRLMVRRLASQTEFDKANAEVQLLRTRKKNAEQTAQYSVS